MAEMFEVGGNDQDVVGWIKEAQEAFKGFRDESWLKWGRQLVMPQVFLDREARLAREKAVKDREEVEAASARKVMAEGAERTRKLKELRERYQRKEIAKEEFVREVRRLEEKSGSDTPLATQMTIGSAAGPLVKSSLDDAAGEASLDSSSEGENDEVRLKVLMKPGPKRKSDQDPDELREVEGLVCRKPLLMLLMLIFFSVRSMQKVRGSESVHYAQRLPRLPTMFR